MSNSQLLNTVITEMAAKKGYPHTTGYLQSLLMQVMSSASKQEQDSIASDLQYTLNTIRKS